jgi:tight adherence protein B
VNADSPVVLTVLAALLACLAWPPNARTPPPRPRGVTGGEPRGLYGPGRGREGFLLRSDRRASRQARDDLADFVALVAGPLKTGLPPGVAVDAAIRACRPVHPALEELVSELGRVAAAGEPLAAVWLSAAAPARNADLRFVGQAWLLSERTGAPLAPALEEAERVLRGRSRARTRVDSLAAGPRASMAVLSLLPLSGPLVGAAFGLGPTALYLGSTVSRVSGAVGVGLAAFGWWWGRRILARALVPRPVERTSRPPAALPVSVLEALRRRSRPHATAGRR